MKLLAQQRNARPIQLVAMGALLMLAGCGGGGGGGGGDAGGSTGGTGGTGSTKLATITSASTGTPLYGQVLQLTLNGSNLDQGLSVTATACGAVTLNTAKSSATTAVYQCTVSAVGAGQWTVTRSSDSSMLSTQAFNVPVPQVTMTLSNGQGVSGSIVITLAPTQAPITVNNFLWYVNSGFYTGTVIHRVSPGFVIQGGGYTSPLDANNQNLKPTTAAPIALEVGKGLSNTQWTLAMARTSDPNSATSQFFINLADNSGQLDPGLSAGYAVFGTVTGGTSVVTAVTTAPCTALPLFLPSGECTPSPNVVITSATQTQ
jgi:peptidyl-prolyl cis-trans isomerase A (cyclophilin A)